MGTEKLSLGSADYAARVTVLVRRVNVFRKNRVNPFRTLPQNKCAQVGVKQNQRIFPEGSQ